MHNTYEKGNNTKVIFMTKFLNLMFFYICLESITVNLSVFIQSYIIPGTIYIRPSLKKCFFGIAALGFQTQEGEKDLFLFFKVKILNEYEHCVTEKKCSWFFAIRFYETGGQIQTNNNSILASHPSTVHSVYYSCLKFHV